MKLSILFGLLALQVNAQELSLSIKPWHDGVVETVKIKSTNSWRLSWSTDCTRWTQILQRIIEEGADASIQVITIWPSRPKAVFYRFERLNVWTPRIPGPPPELAPTNTVYIPVPITPPPPKSDQK